MKREKAIIPELVWVVFFLFVYFCVVTYPLVTSLTTKIPGLGADAYNNSWNFWWVKHAVINLKQNPFVTNYLFYPLSVDISGQLSILYSIFLLPITMFFGYITSYNSRIIFSFFYYLRDFADYALPLIPGGNDIDRDAPEYLCSYQYVYVIYVKNGRVPMTTKECEANFMEENPLYQTLSQLKVNDQDHVIKFALRSK